MSRCPTTYPHKNKLMMNNQMINFDYKGSQSNSSYQQKEKNVETGLSVLGNQTMNSLQIAELTGKLHKHVLRDIDNLLEQGVTETNFGLSEYKDTTGRKLRCYNLTKKGCLILASGYDALLREKIINRWEELELKQQSQFTIPQTYSEALRLAAEQSEQIEAQQKQIEVQKGQIEENKPKVLFANSMIGSKSSCLIGELAKILTQNGYKIGQNRLFDWLRSNHFLGSIGERYNIPNQQYVEQGLFEIKEGTRTGDNGEMHITKTTKVTCKGQLYFINKFLLMKECVVSA